LLTSLASPDLHQRIRIEITGFNFGLGIYDPRDYIFNSFFLFAPTVHPNERCLMK